MNRRFQMRASRASGSAHAKIAKALAKGWHPGLRVREVLARRSRRNPNAATAAGVAQW